MVNNQKQRDSEGKKTHPLYGLIEWNKTKYLTPPTTKGRGQGRKEGDKREKGWFCMPP